MNLLKKALLDCFNKKKLISISIRKFDVFHIGYIEIIENNILVLAEVDTISQLEKKTKIFIDKISFLCYDDIYNNDLLLVRNQVFLDNAPRIFHKHSSIMLAIKKSKENSIIGSFFKGENYYIGKVFDFDSVFLILNSITYQGIDDGFTVMKINDITKIRINSRIELKVNHLYKIKNKDGM